MSATLVDQLKLKRTNLDKPLGLQLAVQGSRSKINSSVEVEFSYQNIKTLRRFDVANLCAMPSIEAPTPFENLVEAPSPLRGTSAICSTWNSPWAG